MAAFVDLNGLHGWMPWSAWGNLSYRTWYPLYWISQAGLGSGASGVDAAQRQPKRASPGSELMTSLHIGIVACSAPGAALCYETICIEASQAMGRHHNPEVSLHTVDFAEHVRCMEQDDWDGVARLILASVNKLATIGAAFAICPDNTAHIAIEKVI